MVTRLQHGMDPYCNGEGSTIYYYNETYVSIQESVCLCVFSLFSAYHYITSGYAYCILSTMQHYMYLILSVSSMRITGASWSEVCQLI